jgi:GAF domain-containing protein
MGAPLSPNEPESLEELHSLEILDTRINHQLEMITQITSRITGTPITLVSMVDDERRWFKAKWGLDASETPREHPFCAHAILDRETMVVTNATEDERFSDNPLVTGDPNIRFYAGARLITQNGHPVGTLCVIDTEPRNISDEDLTTLRHLSTLAVGILQNETKQAKREVQTQTAVTARPTPTR